MSAHPTRGPWSARLWRRPSGDVGVVVVLDVGFATPEVATEAAQALVAQLDTRVEALGRRLREEAAERPTPDLRPATERPAPVERPAPGVVFVGPA